jgi:pteridine reductase
MRHMSSNAASSLAGKVALVTGAAKRVGAVIVECLHASGANVAIHCRRSRAEGKRLAERLNQARRDSAVVITGELLDSKERQALVPSVLQAFGRLDILVNNASTFYPTPLGSITEAQFDDLIGTNLRAPLFLAQAAAPELRLRSGLIVNLVDIHAQRPLPNYLVYSAAKAGLVMLTRGLARELGPEVRVNGIAPGPILWPEGGADAALQAKILERTALKRMGSPEEIAKAVRFFALDAPYVTGQILAVDGGRSIGW